MLIRHEAERLKPYADQFGNLTIGVGRNLADRGISHDEAMILLTNDINLCIAQATHQFGWFEGLSDRRQMAVIDMIFNLGITRFNQFSKTIAFIASGDFKSASEEMLRSAWAQQVGDRATELSQMILNG